MQTLVQVQTPLPWTQGQSADGIHRQLTSTGLQRSERHASSMASAGSTSCPMAATLSTWPLQILTCMSRATMPLWTSCSDARPWVLGEQQLLLLLMMLQVAYELQILRYSSCKLIAEHVCLDNVLHVTAAIGKLIFSNRSVCLHAFCQSYWDTADFLHNVKASM